jgi:outer membrane protein OmpA-like peptidoglycan-associated protein
MVASDGKTLLFTSGRPDALDLQVGDMEGFHGSGSNNIDLYVSFKDKEGEWQTPVNLGKAINTPFIERTPFLHPDMKTLYFSSDGHGGLGRLDVYKTTRLDDSWTNWSKPVNLGKSINTPENDWGYKVSTDGKRAYFAFMKEKEQGQDLYQIDLPKNMQPNEVSTVSGTLTDRIGNPLFAEIIWEDLETGKEVGRLKSDPETGTFFITLPNDKKYSYYIEKDGYFPKSNNIDLTDKNKQVELKETLSLVKIEEMIAGEQTMQLKNLFFDPNKYVLKEASYLELNRLANLIKKYDLKIRIEGHTDSEGTEKDNLLLSQNRANAVKEYLVEKGFDATKIFAKGYGETKPVAENKTPTGRQLNRRVEVLFLKE